MPFHCENIEGEKAFNIPPDWHAGRRPGISAMLRVKDEEEFIEPCLMSIKDFFDEIVIALQPCRDGTPEKIVRLGLPHVRVYSYPFRLNPNGPGHDAFPENSVHDNAYYYNWALSKTRCRHVCKWDGDMVALPSLDGRLRQLVLSRNITKFMGLNIAGEALAWLSREKVAGMEPRFFRVAPHTFYEQGRLTQSFAHDYRSRIATIRRPVFLHFKNAKCEASATKIWPDNWRELEHFRRLHTRRQPSEPYHGPLPEALKAKIVRRALHHAQGAGLPSGDEPVGWRHDFAKVADVLFGLRARGRRGDIVQIGDCNSAASIFLARLAESLFPASRTIRPGAAAQLDQLHGGTADPLPKHILMALIDAQCTEHGWKRWLEAISSRLSSGGICSVVGLDERACLEAAGQSRPELRRSRLEIIARAGGVVLLGRRQWRLLGRVGRAAATVAGMGAATAQLMEV